ncbi:hypothetical protein ACD589_00480 [Rhizobium sp. 814_E9_N1_1]|uniref:hypothetical protein n=1 Tax=unclassified Rhizobium TaxID=2613769 RepID=UPI003F1E5B99
MCVLIEAVLRLAVDHTIQKRRFFAVAQHTVNICVFGFGGLPEALSYELRGAVSTRDSQVPGEMAVV